MCVCGHTHICSDSDVCDSDVLLYVSDLLTICLGLDNLSGPGQSVWAWTICLGLDNLSGPGQSVWAWTICLGLDNLSGPGQSVWAWTICLGLDNHKGLCLGTN